MNVPKLALAGIAIAASAIGLGVFAIIKIIDDCTRANGWR